jgi:hypothetical protein
MDYLVKYTLRNDTMFRSTIQTSNENLKVTESLVCSVAQAHQYDFNNPITPIDIVSMTIEKI